MSHPLEYRPGSPFQNGKLYGDPGVSEQGFISHEASVRSRREADSRPLNKVFRESLRRMSPEDARTFEEGYQQLSLGFQGSGGP